MSDEAPLAGSAPLIDAHAHFYHAASGRADWERVNAARLRAGCVGVVITDPAHRGQGIGKALMRDSFAHARSRGQALLLLHGLADYYRPFGYADVFDATEHAISRTAILDAPPSPYRVREATTADADT